MDMCLTNSSNQEIADKAYTIANVEPFKLEFDVIVTYERNQTTESGNKDKEKYP